MKTTILKSLSLLGISMMMTLAVAAQDDPKVKTTENETKYKTDDQKNKGEKG